MKKTVTLSLLMLLSFIAFSQGVTIYENANFKGKSKILTSETNWLADWNDKISSIKVSKGYKIQIFSDANFEGQSKIIESDWTIFENELEWNDNISSIKIINFPGTKGATIYEDANFEGKSKILISETNWLADWNDKISSIKVSKGYKIQIFSDANFEGQSKIIESDWTVSANNPEWNDNISSIKYLNVPRITANELPRNEGNISVTKASIENANVVKNINVDKEEIRTKYNNNNTKSKVKAANVIKVIYSMQNGGGSFTNTDGNHWNETNNQKSEDFKEISRDQWSIYLRNSEMSVAIQIDLFNMKVFSDPFGSGKREIYTIFEVKEK